MVYMRLRGSGGGRGRIMGGGDELEGNMRGEREGSRERGGSGDRRNEHREGEGKRREHEGEVNGRGKQGGSMSKGG